VCGKTARTVRREGTAKAVPYPYRVNLAERRDSAPTLYSPNATDRLTGAQRPNSSWKRAEACVA
jgi:hypothetical protein